VKKEQATIFKSLHIQLKAEQHLYLHL